MTESPQAQADLWSDGRPLMRWGLGLLRRWSRNHRYAYLYPDGPNPKVVFEAYQRFTTELLVRHGYHDQNRSTRWIRRRFKRSLRRAFMRDAWHRDTRVRYRLPNARPSQIDKELPPVVRAALQEVRPEARLKVASFLTDHRQDADQLVTDPNHKEVHERRRLALGLEEFRNALTQTLLDQPATLQTIHPQFLYYTQPPLPWTVSDTWRSWLLIRLPLQLFLIFSLVFCSAYGWAYYRFNDEILAEFLTTHISSILDGDLAFERVHWGPTLAFDLLVGRAHLVDVKGVRVYEGYKYARQEGGPAHGTAPLRKETAYAEHLKARLVLHEVIPWNRIGVPRVFNIPWKLHFTKIDSIGQFWVGARSYVDPETQTRKISLTDAFGPSDDSPPTYGYRRISFVVDDTFFPLIEVPLDFLDDGEWATSLKLHNARLKLHFAGDYPERAAETPDIPLRYLLHADQGTGEVIMLDERFEINRIDELEIGAGYGRYPMGDLSAILNAEIEGGHCQLSGVLTDVFLDRSGVDVTLRCEQPDGLFTTILPVEPGDTGPVMSSQGPNAQVSLEISGALADPYLEFQAQSLQLDAQLDPELKVKDIDLVAQLRSQKVPEAMRDLYTPTGGEQDHWIVSFEHFAGQMMQGQVQTPARATPPQLILPEHAEPFVFAGAFEVNKLDLSQGGPSIPSTYRHAQGGLDVHRLIFGETLGAAGPELPRPPIHERFGDIWPRYLPTFGPAPKSAAEPEPPMTLKTLEVSAFDLTMQDPKGGANLPPRIGVDGLMTWDSTKGLSIRNAQVKTQGARLVADLQINAELDHISNAAVGLDIHDGESFFEAMALPEFTKELTSELEFSGPLGKLSGPPGSLSTPSASIAGLSVGGLDKAKLQFRRGALVLDAPEFSLLGGKGPLRAELWPHLGEPKDPTMRAKLSLRSLAQDDLLGWPVSFSNAQLDFVVDDGKGKPRSIYDIHARGHAFVPRLTMAKVRYHNARAAFVVTPDRIELDELSLRYGRALSPKLAPNLRVSTGIFAISGSMGLSSDPSLDLFVSSSGLPLRALTNFAGGQIPVRGRIGQGSQVTVKGRVSQPEVEGSIHLASVNAANLPLGRGKLEFTSHQRSQGSGSRRMDIREVRVKGQLKSPSQKKSGLRVDATLAVGRNKRGQEFQELAGTGSFSTIPLQQLLTLPHQDRWKQRLDGELKDLSIHASYCPSSTPMLKACKTRLESQKQRNAEDIKVNALALDLRLEQGWAGVRKRNAGKRKARALGRCPAFASACMQTPLHAQLSEGALYLQSPWIVHTGPARNRSSLSLQGSFDLHQPDSSNKQQTCDDFESRLAGAQPSGLVPRHDTRGQIRGTVDLSGLDPAILPLGWGPMRGRVDLDLDLLGPIAAPYVTGRVSNRSSMLSWQLVRTETASHNPIELHVSDLNIDVRGDLAKLDADISALRGKIDLGTGPRGATGIGLTGACRGEYAINMGQQSKLDAGLLALVFPEEIQQSEGSIGIPEFSLRGNWLHDFRAKAPALKDFRARLSMNGHNAEFSVADEDLRIRSGEIDLRLCHKGAPCAGSSEQEGLAVRIGSANALESARPMDAVGIQTDSSGHTQYIWGHLTLPPSLAALRFAELAMALDQFPYRQDDNAGRPELIAHLSSQDLRLRVTPDGFSRVSGHLTADKARWLRDASQGVRSVVSFADPVPAPPSTLSPTLSALELDLELKTTSPFRVDNNILRNLEAQAELHLGGSLGAMEVTGPIEVQRGILDLALLGGAYVIDRGRVRLNRRIADSEVDISATRKAPVRIENELHQVSLDLDGPLDAIRWRCHSTAQRNRGLQTLRGCIDYLIFDAGNAALTPQEEIDTGSLNLTRRSLTLFGNLTQVELNRFVEDELPRTGQFLPIVRGRVRQLGLELQIQTREDWFSWRWGRLGLGYSYLRGYSGSFLRDSQSLSSQLHLLDDVALEMQLGLRTYSNVALVLQPPRFGSVELGHRIRIPGLR